MKKETIFYSVIGVAALLLVVGYLWSQYIDYKQLELSREKAIQDCIVREVGNLTGIRASLKEQDCRAKFQK